jgi:hypothetical protein
MLEHVIRKCLPAAFAPLLAWGLWTCEGAALHESVKVPVIYCTDLFHPHDDPDDHFDLATLYAIPEFEVRGVVLDQGTKQLERPGKIPVSQLNFLSGRHVPTAIGLGAKLKSPTDKALEQESQYQGGVDLMLEQLRRATGRVDIITVGSVRDLVAAFNRQPTLFHDKAGRIMVFIGEAAKRDYREYNVELDPSAFIGLMRSGLNVYWVPCFDGGLWHNAGHASFWQASHAALLSNAPPSLVQYFIYALEKEKADPIKFLGEPVNSARREALFKQTRNLWCAAIFRGLVTGGAVEGKYFAFEPVDVTVGDDATIQYGEGKEAKRVMRFCVKDLVQFGPSMTNETAECLGRFPMSVRPGSPGTTP